MKRIQKITRVRLDISQSDPFHLIGLVSAEADYKLSLAINKKFRINLKNISPVKINSETGTELTFSMFSETSGSKDNIFTLISNRSGNSFLLPKLKNIDYIFKVHDTENERNIGQITDSLREIEAINAVFNIDLKSLKDRNLQYLTH
jgi:hypothetical protein